MFCSAAAEMKPVYILELNVSAMTATSLQGPFMETLQEVGLITQASFQSVSSQNCCALFKMKCTALLMNLTQEMKR